MTVAADKSLRVSVIQHALHPYRVPVWAELARRPGIDLTLHLGDTVALGDAPLPFKTNPHRIRGLGTFHWDNAMLDAASPAQSDVLIIGEDPHFLSLLPALRKARRRGVAVVIWGHGLTKRPSKMRERIRQHLFSKADALLFYSVAGADNAVRAGHPAEKIFVAPNSVDQQPILEARRHWEANPERLDAFREAHDLLDGPRLLFISRLKARNRIGLLLEAVAALVPDRPGVRLVIIGDGAARETLQAGAETLGIADRVTFTGALYDEREIAPWCLSSDLFVYPAQIGLSLFHAFGYGLPTVADDHPDLRNPEREALIDGVNGAFFRSGDLTALVAVLRRLTGDPAKLAELGRAAERTVREKHTVPKMVDGFVAAIRHAARRS